MRLMTLNIWGGHVRAPLLNFIEAQRDTDIFCLQEVYHNAHKKMATDDREVSFNIFSELHELLPNYNAFFRPVLPFGFGIGIFIKKEFEVLDEGEINIYDNPNYPGYGPTHPRILQWIKCNINDQSYSIMNVHGLWNGKGKTDSPERLAQSQKIRTFMDTITTPKILCGDLNLRPDTESIKILETGMNNLVKKFDIHCTRTNFYQKEEKYADYVFTCPKITINNFCVLQDEVSDHSPLVLDFF